MNIDFITLTKDNIEKEHICCAFSDKKCQESYNLKKEWLKRQFENGYVFRRLNERAKVFIEYGPAENGWVPVKADNYLLINCFWVAGQYKGKGYAKALLQTAIDDALQQGKDGLVTVVGTKKFHFMSDTKWLLQHGFVTVEKLSDGFSLLALTIKPDAPVPAFKECVKGGECPEKNGLVVYYTNRCPFTEYYVKDSLIQLAEKYRVPLKIVKLETMEQAQSAPTPATIFAIYNKGKFVTTDISICTEAKFVKMLNPG